MADKQVQLIVAMFIVALVGIAFLQETANSVQGQTVYDNNVNETLNIASARIPGSVNSVNGSIQFILAEAPLITNKTATSTVVLTNGTVIIPSSNYTYNQNNGTLFLINDTVWQTGAGKGNLTFATYSAGNINYITDAASRSVTSIIVIFFALAIAVGVLVYLFTPGNLLSRYINR